MDKEALKIFQFLMYDQFGFGVKLFFAKLYTRFTQFELCELIGDGEIILIYTQELNRREDHLQFLKKLATLNKNICIYVYRRKFSIRHFFDVRLGQVGILANAEKIVNELLLRKSRRVIMFCPHLYFSHALNTFLRKNEFITASLQHGLYKYEKYKYDLYKAATVCDVAFAFDERYKDFFKNCTRVFFLGNYLSPVKINVEQRVEGNVFYLTYFHVADIMEIGGIILSIASRNSSNYIIFHPVQSSSERKMFMNFIGDEFIFKRSKSWMLGNCNYFYNTTAYQKIIFKESDVAYLISNKDTCERIYSRSEDIEITNLATAIDEVFA